MAGEVGSVFEGDQGSNSEGTKLLKQRSRLMLGT